MILEMSQKQQKSKNTILAPMTLYIFNLFFHLQWERSKIFCKMATDYVTFQPVWEVDYLDIFQYFWNLLLFRSSKSIRIDYISLGRQFCQLRNDGLLSLQTGNKSYTKDLTFMTITKQHAYLEKAYRIIHFFRLDLNKQESSYIITWTVHYYFYI